MSTPGEYVAVPGDARRAARAVLSRRYRSGQFALCMLFPALVVLLGLVARVDWVVPVGGIMALLVWLPMRRLSVSRMRTAYSPGARVRATVTEDELLVSSDLSESAYAWADFSSLQQAHGFVVLDHRTTKLIHTIPEALFGEAELSLARRGIAERRAPLTEALPATVRETQVSDAFRDELTRVVSRGMLRSPLMLFGFAFVAACAVWWTLSGAVILTPILVVLALALVWASRKGARRLVGQLYPPSAAVGVNIELSGLTVTDPRGGAVTIPLTRISSVEARDFVVFLALRDQAARLPLPRELVTDADLAILASAARPA